MYKSIQQYPIVGTSEKSLILNIDGTNVYCHNSVYDYLLKNVAEWYITTQDFNNVGLRLKWVTVNIPVTRIPKPVYFVR